VLRDHQASLRSVQHGPKWVQRPRGTR
jgi:hypothetical protein